MVPFLLDYPTAQKIQFVRQNFVNWTYGGGLPSTRTIQTNPCVLCCRSQRMDIGWALVVRRPSGQAVLDPCMQTLQAALEPRQVSAPHVLPLQRVTSQLDVSSPPHLSLACSD